MGTEHELRPSPELLEQLKTHTFRTQSLMEVSARAFLRARCSGCKALRLMDFDWRGNVEIVNHFPTSMDVRLKPPGVGILMCRDCHRQRIAMFWWRDDGGLQITCGGEGSIATPSTPEGVEFYLEEAAKCVGASAPSAAAAMYRAALEHLLLQQGFVGGMLDAKIKELGARIDAGKGPAWAVGLPIELLDALKRIGNGAIHANGGDITKQSAINQAALDDIEAVIESLLELVYERPTRDAERLARIKATAAALTPAKK